jgi:hypothetical protein
MLDDETQTPDESSDTASENAASAPRDPAVMQGTTAEENE